MLIYFYLVFMTKEFCLPFFYTNKRKYDIIFKRFPCTGAYKFINLDNDYNNSYQWLDKAYIALDVG